MIKYLIIISKIKNQMVVLQIYCSKCGKKLDEGSKFCNNCGAAINLDGKSETVIDSFANDRQLQEHWIKRLIAYLIDSVIVGIIAAILLGIFFFPVLFSNPASFANLVTFPFGMGLIYILYFPFAESMYGFTLGKNLMGLKVVTKSGEKPSIDKSFIRNISKIHWVLLLLDLIAGLLTSTNFKEKYTDKIAGTTIVYK
jgi:uncharacterized RDD family membrane protein YckC